MQNSLASLLTSASAVFFDFDGPICNVFAGLPAPRVARELVVLIGQRDALLARQIGEIGDPLEVLRLSQNGSGETVEFIDQALTDAELKAVSLAGQPTPGAEQAIHAVAAAGKLTAVVSNNSAEAVDAYLSAQGLRSRFGVIIGRPHNHPDRMKPHPSSVIQAAQSLGVEPSACVLIGDAVTDIQAAHAAGASALGFANRPGKALAFAAAGAEAVVTDMKAIADTLP